MTRKRLKKLLMSKGIKRNSADWISSKHSDPSHAEFWRKTEPMFSEEFWKPQNN